MAKEAWPLWVLALYAHLGQREKSPGDNANILNFFQLVRAYDTTTDETPSCAAGVGSSFERVGIGSTRSLMARSYTEFGKALDRDAWRVGAVAVLPRPPDPDAGHVTFVVDWNFAEGTFKGLGSNQSDSVSIAEFDMADVIALRWPAKDALLSPVFDIALKQVRSIEGGYTDDPRDPGGPTNKGITLGEFVKWRDGTGTKEQLKALSDAEARAIYLTNYWFQAWCDQLPVPLAVMQFDCAVNQGVGDAALFLQKAIGAEADGEIGPKTLAAAHAIDVRKAINNYHAIREADYRSLSQFSVYGNGWLRRNNEARDLALGLINAPISPVTNEPPKEEPPMADPIVPLPPAVEPKWWGESMTIWGTIITFASTVLPVLAKFYGIDLTPAMIGDLGDKAVLALQAVGGLVGAVMTVWGRVRAVQPLAQKPVTLKM